MRKVALVALCGIFLAGCAADGQVNPTSELPDGQDVGGGEGRLVDIDGVQCVVIDGPGSVAVSCNWDAYNRKAGL